MPFDSQATITIVLTLTKDIYQSWENLATLSQNRDAALDQAEATQQRIDELCIQFAKKIAVRCFTS